MRATLETPSIEKHTPPSLEGTNAKPVTMPSQFYPSFLPTQPLFMAPQVYPLAAQLNPFSATFTPTTFTPPLQF